MITQGARSSDDQRFDRIERELTKVLTGQILVKWMVGFAIVLNMTILIRVSFQ